MTVKPVAVYANKGGGHHRNHRFRHRTAHLRSSDRTWYPAGRTGSGDPPAPKRIESYRKRHTAGTRSGNPWYCPLLWCIGRLSARNCRPICRYNVQLISPRALCWRTGFDPEVSGTWCPRPRCGKWNLTTWIHLYPSAQTKKGLDWNAR